MSNPLIEDSSLYLHFIIIKVSYDHFLVGESIMALTLRLGRGSSVSSTASDLRWITYLRADVHVTSRRLS
jgi:hypothetical protein